MGSNKMKIGILTLPLRDNYGGILQAFALQKFLKDRGHEVVLIDRQFNEKPFEYFRVVLKKLFFPNKIEKQREMEQVREKVSYFIDKYVSPKTEPFRSSTALNKGISKYDFDAVIVGSDQVWRADYTKEMTKDYFLDFIQGSKTIRASYAASFGKDKWDENYEFKDDITTLLQKFNAISVREDSGIEICKTVFNVDSAQHIDPTLLLSPTDYANLVKNEDEPVRKENLLIYMLDINKDKQLVIDTIAKQIDGKPFSINKPIVDQTASLEQKIYPTVTNWLKGFSDAKYVITDSFHGTIFSLLYNKPFIVYGNQSRGLTRFYSILKKVKLENRVILQNADLKSEIINQEIDWDYVNEIFKKEKIKTDSYFKKLGL